jgi:murein DD-endopeptidase MepM/ murein hydrolase activator NlpD
MLNFRYFAYLFIFFLSACSYHDYYGRPPATEYSRYVKEHNLDTKPVVYYNPNETYIPTALRSSQKSAYTYKPMDLKPKSVDRSALDKPSDKYYEIRQDEKGEVSVVKPKPSVSYEITEKPTQTVQKKDYSEYDGFVSSTLKSHPEDKIISDRKYHIVQKGETLYSISKSYGKDFKEIANLNNITSPYTISIGQKLLISHPETKDKKVPVIIAKPKETTQLKTKPEEVIKNLPKKTTYKISTKPEEVIESLNIQKPKKEKVTVKKGDTLYSIAKRNKIPLKDLIMRNNLKPPYDIKPGQVLYMPGVAFHIVKKGDTLYSISRTYDVNLNSLSEINNLKPPYTLSVGDKLLLPASSTQATSTTQLATTGKEKTKSIAKDMVKTRPSDKGKKSAVIEKPKKSTAQPTAKPKKAAAKPKKSAVKKVMPKPDKRSSSKFEWPVKGKILSSFGDKGNGMHNDGINIKASKGTPVKAAENGVIAYAGNEIKGMGNLVILKHDGGWMTVYAHLDKINVSRTQKIKKGYKIGTVGNSGRVSNSQLHFEIRKGTKALNPKKYLK